MSEPKPNPVRDTLQPPLSDGPHAVALVDSLAGLLQEVHHPDGLKRLSQGLLDAFESGYGFIGHLDATGALQCTVSVRSSDAAAPHISHVERFPSELWTGAWGEVLRTRRAKIDNGAGQQPRTLLGRQTLRSIGVPLVCGERLVGSILLSGKNDAYTSEDLSALQRLARFLAPLLLARSMTQEVEARQLAAQDSLDRRNLEIEKFNVQLRKELARRHAAETQLAAALRRAEYQNRRMLALAQGFVELKTASSPKELLATVAMKTREILRAHQAAVSFQIDDADTSSHEVSVSDDHPLARTREEAWEDARRNFLNMRKKCWQIENIGSFNESGQYEVQPRSFLAVPLFTDDGKQFGLIQAWDRHEGSFDEQDQAVLRQLAEITGADLRLRLTHAELNDAQGELLKANVELRQFVNIASHDLKAPVRGALHLAEWIQEDLAQNNLKEVASQCDLMQTKLKQMRSLIDDLLTYSKAGRFEGNTISVDTSQLVSNCASLLSPPAGFEIRCVSQMPVIQTEIAPLRQVLLNLIGNAIKHHDKQQGSIEISCVPKGEFFEFRVRDDGPGIPESFRDRAFEMFRTLKSKNDGSSTGLGLALIKKIVERCRGTIEISSAEPGRTEFCFLWPKIWVGKR